MFDKLLVAWMAWRQKSDWNEAKRIGYKPTGIEYRIMLEAGLVVLDGKGHFDWEYIEKIDKAWMLLRVTWPEHMIAIELYYLYGRTYRPGRIKMHVSQVKYRRLVEEGRLMLLGATYVVEK